VCCSKPAKYEIEQEPDVWWRFVKVPNAQRTFGSKEAAEIYLSQDIDKLIGNELQMYRRLLWQKERAEDQ
jgi:hypothetical protein